MLDGIVARKLNLLTKFGAAFDTVADICFVGVCLFKLIFVLDISLWLSIWTAGMILIKIINILYGFIDYKTMVAEHTVMNKITGIVLFLFLFVLPFIGFKTCAFTLSAVATFSAIHEWYYIKKGKFIY